MNEKWHNKTTCICLTSVTLSKAMSIIAIFVQSLHISNPAHHFHSQTHFGQMKNSLTIPLKPEIEFRVFSQFNCILLHTLNMHMKLENFSSRHCYVSSFLAAAYTMPYCGPQNKDIKIFHQKWPWCRISEIPSGIYMHVFQLWKIDERKRQNPIGL